MDVGDIGIRIGNVDLGNNEGMIFNNVPVDDPQFGSNPNNGMFGYYINDQQANETWIYGLMQAGDNGGQIGIEDFGASITFGPSNDLAGFDGIGVLLSNYLQFRPVPHDRRAC